MLNIMCPNCKEELHIGSSIQREDVNEEELIILLEKALCKNCRRVFDVHFKVADIVDIGTEDDYYLDEDEYDEELGDVFIEKGDYVLTHKAYKTIEELRTFVNELSSEYFDEDDNPSDIMEILTVAHKDENIPYVVSFELILNHCPTFMMSTYISNQTGLILYDSSSENIEDYNAIDEIEESCIDALRSFTKHMTALNERE